VTCKDGIAVQASPDLAALTQHQICTEHKGVPAGVSNPPPAPSPAPPLGSTLGESNALDVFFVRDFPGATVFGVSWINGDGVSIGGLASFLLSGPRFDNLAHEIGHAVALDHTTFGIGTATNNLMTSGSSRTVPSTSGCSTTGVLYQLGDLSVYPSPVPTSCQSAPANPPIADQLTSGSACSDLATCTNQVGAISLSPLINKTLATAANAGGGAPAPAGVAGAATASCPPPGGFPFAVSAAPGTGENGDSINSIIIALPDISGITFSGSSPATQTPCGSGGVNIINQVRLNGNSGIGNPNCVKSINLAPPSVQCLQIFFSTGDAQGNAFVAGDSVTFNLALNKDNTTIVQNHLLTGTQFTVVTTTPNTPTDPNTNTSVAYSTTTTFGDVVNGVFTADSRFPDFATPNQINPNFVSAAVVQLGPDLSKCTPPYTGSGSHLQCPGGSLPKLDTCPPGVLYCND
jgi:hypothetical protein